MERPCYLIRGSLGLMFYAFEFDDVLAAPVEGASDQFALQLVRTHEKHGRLGGTLMVGSAAMCEAALLRIADHVSTPNPEPVIDLVDPPLLAP